MESDKRIEELLEGYFEATTTVNEEEILRDYFTGPKVAPHLKPYVPLFQFTVRAKEERFTKELPFAKARSRRGIGKFRWLSVAAAILLMIGGYFGALSYQDYRRQQQAEYAYQQTKKALDLLAENFTKGTEKIGYLAEFDEAKQKIYKNH